MKYTEAKARALLLTAERQVNHVIFETNGYYHVAMEKHWTGDIIETVKYEKAVEKTEEPKKASKSRPYPVQAEDKPEAV